MIGATAGVGLTAVWFDRLAVAMAAGAEVLTDVSEDLSARVLDEGGADVVFDVVGGDVFATAFRACRPEGRLLCIGFASGEAPRIPGNRLLVNNPTVIGINIGDYLKFRPQVFAGSLKTLMRWYQAGRLKPHISHVLPLERVAEVMDLLRHRKSTGKVVITM